MYDRKNLILDFETNPYSFDLELTHDGDNLDFENYGSLSDRGLIETNLLFYYDFSHYSSLGNISSTFGWDKAKPYGSKLILNGTGSTISYQMDSYLNKKYLSLDGGYLSGIYKTDLSHQTLPKITQEGYSLNYWVNLGDINSGGYLFRLGDEINGYGFYYRDGLLGYKSYVGRIGQPLEEPIFSGDTGNTTENIVVLETIKESGAIFIGSEENPWVNLSIIFKRNQKLVECCEGCEDNEYILTSPFLECTEFSEIPDTNKGKLTFLINGRPTYSIEIEEPIIDNHIIKIGEGFIGGISIASMYNKPLNIPEIIRNYYGLKTIYKRSEGFGGINNIVNGNLIK